MDFFFFSKNTLVKISEKTLVIHNIQNCLDRAKQICYRCTKNVSRNVTQKKVEVTRDLK